MHLSSPNFYREQCSNRGLKNNFHVAVRLKIVANYLSWFEGAKMKNLLCKLRSAENFQNLR